MFQFEHKDSKTLAELTPFYYICNTKKGNIYFRLVDLYNIVIARLGTSRGNLPLFS